MRTLALSLLLSLAGGRAHAQAQADRTGMLGLGGVVGMPTGVTAKYWIDRFQAVDAEFGVSENLALCVDYLYHGWNAIPKPREGELAAHIALGMRIEDGEFAIRALPGVDYWFQNAPVELFAQIGPSFRLTSGGNVTVDGGLGVRFYFGRAR